VEDSRVTEGLSEPRGDAIVDKWVADARAKAERYQEMRTEVEQVSVTESSGDGLVTVTVDAGGVVSDLRITDRVADHTGAEVAATVLSTMRRAQSKIGEQVSQIVQDTVGDDEAMLNKVVTSYHDRFPEPEPEDESLPDDELRIGEVDETED
jgi:DNA-binding protein YbaB